MASNMSARPACAERQPAHVADFTDALTSDEGAGTRLAAERLASKHTTKRTAAEVVDYSVGRAVPKETFVLRCGSSTVGTWRRDGEGRIVVTLDADVIDISAIARVGAAIEHALGGRLETLFPTSGSTGTPPRCHRRCGTQLTAPEPLPLQVARLMARKLGRHAAVAVAAFAGIQRSGFGGGERPCTRTPMSPGAFCGRVSESDCAGETSAAVSCSWSSVLKRQICEPADAPQGWRTPPT